MSENIPSLFNAIEDLQAHKLGKKLLGKRARKDRSIPQEPEPKHGPKAVKLGLTQREVAEKIADMCGSVDMTAKALEINRCAVYYHIRAIKRDKDGTPEQQETYRIYKESVDLFEDLIRTAWFNLIVDKQDWNAIRYGLRAQCRIFDEMPEAEVPDEVPAGEKVVIEAIDGRLRDK